MAKAAKRFVEDWISRNVEATNQDSEGDAKKVHALAFDCLAAADKAGISRAAIEEECGDLVACISDAIARLNKEAADRLVDRVREDPSA